MSRDIVDTGSLLALVVAAGVEAQPTDCLPAVIQDPNVPPGDQKRDGLVGIASADTDVVEAALVPQGDDVRVVDLVVADPVAVAGNAGPARRRLDPRPEPLHGGASAEGPVGTTVVE
jgi:hypothetical protein